MSYCSDDSDCSDGSDGSDCSNGSDGSDYSDCTGITYTSLEAALGGMTSRLEELDTGLDLMTNMTKSLEYPLTSVAVSSFTNPRILESAPFRSTRFRVKTNSLIGIPDNTVTFAQLCAAIRRTLRIEKNVLGATTFLDVLSGLPEIIE